MSTRWPVCSIGVGARQGPMSDQDRLHAVSPAMTVRSRSPAGSTIVRSARAPVRIRPRSGSPRRSAAVLVTVVRASASGAGERQQVPDRPVELEHASGEHTVDRPDARFVVGHLEPADVEPAERGTEGGGGVDTRHIRCGPSDLHAIATATGSTWMPSQITPTVTDPSASTAPIGPGERWSNGAMAL